MGSFSDWIVGDAPEPSSQFVLVVRLIALLRRAWTEEGVIAWFDRPRTALDGRGPIDLLDESDSEGVLLSLSLSRQVGPIPACSVPACFLGGGRALDES